MSDTLAERIEIPADAIESENILHTLIKGFDEIRINYKNEDKIIQNIYVIICFILVEIF